MKTAPGVVAEVKNKTFFLKPKPISWVLLAKYHRHVQNIHFKIIACYRLLPITMDFYALTWWISFLAGPAAIA